MKNSTLGIFNFIPILPLLLLGLLVTPPTAPSLPRDLFVSPSTCCKHYAASLVFPFGSQHLPTFYQSHPQLPQASF